MSPPEPPLWIVVRHWDRYQHYRDRRPVWVKIYPELLHNPAYLALSLPCRGILIGLILLYADSDRAIPLRTGYVSRALHGRVSNAQLISLSDAGFIEFSASKPLAPPARSRERDREDQEQKQNPASLPVVHYDGNSKKNGLQAFDNPAYTEENPRSWPQS
jgi:hypothetical protein